MSSMAVRPTNPNAPSQPQMGGPGDQKLTSNEAEALRHIGTNVWRARMFGFVIGAGGTVFALRRSGRQVSNFRLFVMSFAGGFASSLFFIPLGIAMSRKSLSTIEDPQHLSRVLQYQMEHRRDKSVNSTIPPVQNSSEDSWNGNADTRDSSNDFANPSGMEWAKRSPTTPKNDSLWNDPASRADWNDSAPSNNTFPSKDSTPAASQDWSTVPSSNDTSPTPGTGPGSRWAQLRNDRTGTPSAWENLRQRSTKESMAQQSASGQRPGSGPTNRESSGSQTRNSAYDNAVAEYNRAMELERRGLDVTTGFDENTQIR
ncbi:hypothetical protein MYAM1_000547 [Malassezia yamatoensis]|uniref:Uncharacterized protein n=1 Tax=Malassezia yamatoensis TaxID=253288 RepID=A0AAJ6CF12_9BASI|nr:hypothetical protein MYAM1_000547 [Malassezia yamatoensis]